MGIYLNACKCESCRNGLAPLTNNSKVNKPLNQFKRKWLPIIIVILAVVLVLLFFSWAVNFDKSGGFGVG